MLRLIVKIVMWVVLGIVLFFAAGEGYAQQSRYRGACRDIW